jgi:hypothetical protein
MDPELRPASQYPDIPVRFYASPGDTAVPMAPNSDLFSQKWDGKTSEHEVVVCSGNHGDPSHFQPDDFLAFLMRCREDAA